MMCGLAGLIVGNKWRTGSERQDLTEVFTRLLVLSEHRGPFATGAAWVDRDGRCQVTKAPLPAREFVRTPGYSAFLDGVSDRTTILLGHTRWPTRGSIQHPFNNHPLIGDGVLLTHNGHIANADTLFRRFNLPRTAEVDSEILLRLAERHSSPAGIDVPAYLRDLARCEGRIAAVVISTARAEHVILLRGNMPLYVWYHPIWHAVAYASEEAILYRAVGSAAEWQPMDLPSGTALVIEITSLQPSARYPFVSGVRQHRGQQRPSAAGAIGTP